MAKSATAGQPAITRAGCYDSSAAKQIQDVTCNGDYVVLSGSADPMPFPAIVQLNTSGVNATTLASPIAGTQPAGDDGKTIFVYDNTGNAHTITTASNKILPSKHILTFNATIGSNARLIAVGGVWVPAGLTGVTAS